MNTSEVSKNDHDTYNIGTIVLLLIFGNLVALFAFTINLLLVIVLLIKPSLRQQSYIVLVLCLAVADFVVSSGAITHGVALALAPKNVNLCRIWMLMFSQGICMSVYFTFIISLNRYMSVVSISFVNKLFDGRRKYALLFIPCAVVAAVNLGVAVGLTHAQQISTYNFRAIVGENHLAYEGYLAALNIPIFIATLVLYILSLRAVHVRFGRVAPHVPTSPNVPGPSGPTPTEVRRKRHLAAMKTLGIIFALLTAGTAPFLFMFLINALQVPVMAFVLSVLGIVMLLNSAVNPIVAIWRLTEVRTEIKYTFCRCCPSLN